MKRFEFSMNKLLNLKKQMLNKEKNELAGLRKQQQAIINEKTAMEKKRLFKSTELQKCVTEGASPQHIANHNYYIECLKGQIEENEVKIKLFQERIDNQLNVILELNKEIESLEKLKEKQFEDYNKGEQKRQEQFIEEFVSYQDFNVNK